MSGFDTSQPITDETALRDSEVAEKANKTSSLAHEDSAGSVDPDELGDATPGPR
jgi:hypothetical protein